MAKNAYGFCVKKIVKILLMNNPDYTRPWRETRGRKERSARSAKREKRDRRRGKRKRIKTSLRTGMKMHEE